MQLLEHSKLHPVFHVSLLKKKIGRKTVARIAPPKVNAEEQPLICPAAILDKRIIKRNNQVVTQLLVEWCNLGRDNATWEDYSILITQFPKFDPWGQGSAEGQGIVMKLSMNKQGNESRQLRGVNRYKIGRASCRERVLNLV